MLVMESVRWPDCGRTEQAAIALQRFANDGQNDALERFSALFHFVWLCYAHETQDVDWNDFRRCTDLCFWRTLSSALSKTPRPTQMEQALYYEWVKEDVEASLHKPTPCTVCTQCLGISQPHQRQPCPQHPWL